MSKILRAEREPTKGLGSGEEQISFQESERSKNRDGRDPAVEWQRVGLAAAEVMNSAPFTHTSRIRHPDRRRMR